MTNFVTVTSKNHYIIRFETDDLLNFLIMQNQARKLIDKSQKERIKKNDG